MSLNLEKETKKSSANSSLAYILTLGIVAITVIVCTYLDKTKTSRVSKLENGSYLKITDCRKMQDDHYNCTMYIVRE